MVVRELHTHFSFLLRSFVLIPSNHQYSVGIIYKIAVYIPLLFYESEFIFIDGLLLYYFSVLIGKVDGQTCPHHLVTTLFLRIAVYHEKAFIVRLRR